MFTKNFAVAVLVAVLGLTGCGAVTVIGDPNRPFPPQPAVSENVRNELATRKMQEIPVFVSSRIFYYDGSNAMKIMAEIEKGGEKASFTRNFPRLDNPSLKTVTNSRNLLAAFKNHLKEEGFSVTEIPCEVCLTVITDYTEFWEKSVIFFAARARVYYRGDEILISRDDRMSSWRKGLITLPGSELDNFFKKAVTVVVGEMLQSWNANIATVRPDRISAIQQ